MNPQLKAYSYALIAIAFWSTMSSAFKISLNYIAFDMLLFFAVWAAVIVLGLLLIPGGNWKLLPQTTTSEWKRSLLMGFLNPFAYYLILFKAYELLPAQEAGVLNYTWPVVLVILSVPLLGQKIGKIGILAIVVSFSGLLVISTKGNILGLQFGNPQGVMLAVGSAFFWALYWIINMKDKREALVKTFTNMLIGSIFISIYIIAGNKLILPGYEALLGAIYIGLFEMGITFVIWLKALKLSVNTAKVSNLVFMSPFLALFWIRLFVGEKILFSTIVGLVLIVAGIMIQQLDKAPAVKPSSR